MAIKVSFEPEAKQELASLPTRELQVECLRLLSGAGKNVLGLPLGPHPQTGDLTGCRKIYFGETAYRAVVRYVPDELSPTNVIVIAIGERNDMSVYRVAAQRLMGGE